MVRRKIVIGAAVTLALAWARPAAAGSMVFKTGDVEKDLPSGSPGVLTIVNHPYPNTQISNPNAVSQAGWITQAGRINGHVIKDMRVFYDQPADVLYVGVNFFGVAGDADGNGVVGTTDPRFNGVEYAKHGFGTRSDNSITVGFDLKNSGQPTFVAGIASDKSVVGPGTNGFTVNWAKDASSGLSYAYGASLNAQHNGNLAFEPSKDHPDFAFAINNLSKIPGFDIDKGIGITAFAGASDDVDVGEDAVPYTHIAFQTVPEPAAALAWSIVLAGAAGHALRRRRGGPGRA